MRQRGHGDGDRVTNILTMVGHLCSDINQRALAAVLPFLVVGDGYGYAQAAMLIFAANIASAVIQPLFGWLGDRHPAPWLMALGVFLAGAGMAGVGVAGSYPLVLLSSMICGIGVAMFHPEGGRLANLSAGSRTEAGMSVFAVGGNVGFFVGPIISAAALSAFGTAGTLVLLVPSTACALVLLGFTGRFRRLGGVREAGDARQAQPERWGSFGIVLGVLSIRSVLSYGLMAFIPLFLVGHLGQAESVGAFAVSAFALAGAAATLVSGWVAERLGTHRLMVACLALGAGATAFLAEADSVALVFALTAVASVGVDLFYPSSVALAMGYVPRHLGSASGLCYGVAICVGGAAEPFLGMAGDAIGLAPVLWALAALSLAAALLSGLSWALDARRVGAVRPKARA